MREKTIIKGILKLVECKDLVYDSYSLNNRQIKNISSREKFIKVEKSKYFFSSSFTELNFFSLIFLAHNKKKENFTLFFFSLAKFCSFWKIKSQRKINHSCLVYVQFLVSLRKFRVFGTRSVVKISEHNQIDFTFVMKILWNNWEKQIKV